MKNKLTSKTQESIDHIDAALMGKTEDDLGELVSKLKSLEEKALKIQKISAEQVSGNY